MLLGTQELSGIERKLEYENKNEYERISPLRVPLYNIQKMIPYTVNQKNDPAIQTNKLNQSHSSLDIV